MGESFNLAGWLIIIGLIIIFVPLIGAAGNFIKNQIMLLNLNAKQSTFLTVAIFVALAYLLLIKTNIAEMLHLLVKEVV
ncbi:hypothetical protein [Desulfofalx alkaliphila]|uniref:hypothetical protein n=1 Tax=Desulfofalx alkaliphila TaxID=105483 RepID=UPI0004E0FC71|nr:hypothetical protein [Desulfofalx alkaliphila]